MGAVGGAGGAGDGCCSSERKAQRTRSRPRISKTRKRQPPRISGCSRTLLTMAAIGEEGASGVGSGLAIGVEVAAGVGVRVASGVSLDSGVGANADVGMTTGVALGKEVSVSVGVNVEGVAVVRAVMAFVAMTVVAGATSLLVSRRTRGCSDASTL